MTIGITHINIDLSRVPGFLTATKAAIHDGVGRAAVTFKAAAIGAVGGNRSAALGEATRQVGAAAARASFGETNLKPGTVWNTPSMPGGFPRSQSGQLAGEIVAEPDGEARFLVGTNLAHGKYMEFGSHPRAKKGKFLAIPLNYEASRIQKTAGAAGLKAVVGLEILYRTRRGFILGFKAAQLIGTKGKGKTEYVEEQVKLSRAMLDRLANPDALVNFTRKVVRRRRKEDTGADKELFALVPDVTILARPWLLPTMANSGNQAEAVKVFGDTIRAAINGAGVGGVKAAAQ